MPLVGTRSIEINLAMFYGKAIDRLKSTYDTKSKFVRAREPTILRDFDYGFIKNGAHQEKKKLKSTLIWCQENCTTM